MCTLFVLLLYRTIFPFVVSRVVNHEHINSSLFSLTQEYYGDSYDGNTLRCLSLLGMIHPHMVKERDNP
ncbi:hypothetical protein Y032_0045g1295 [Ancylostoma ceylanicum]|uniref:Uncharacterized protein n=1 Tax=Ancylostoma ceylanicum TaxID=53326 RepID=A0A016UCW3_9BILA|nr:hypothetical protein Y032_0045g1295 [Ancylostoma ceylanicum]